MKVFYPVHPLIRLIQILTKACLNLDTQDERMLRMILMKDFLILFIL